MTDDAKDTETHSPSLGSAFAEWTRFFDWPPIDPTPMFKLNILDGGSIEAIADTEGAIDFSLSIEGHGSIQLKSARLTLHGPALRMAFTWELPDELYVIANGNKIASTKDRIAKHLELPAVRPRKLKDFTEANNIALEERCRAADSLKPQPGRRLRSLDEERAFLEGATQQLSDLIDAIEAGHHFHIFGCIALIRSLIARGRRNFQPLLQRVAGRLRMPLLLYAPILDDDPIAATNPQAEYHFAANPTEDEGLTAIDLDAWLNTTAIHSGDLTLTQNEMIRTITDAVGSHFDPDADPQLDMLERTMLYAGQTEVPMLIAYTLVVARCVRHLSIAVLRENLSKQPQ